MLASIELEHYRLSYADWLELPHDSGLWEIVRGELLVTPPPAIAHQRLSRDIAFALHRHLEANGTGELLEAPTGVKLAKDTVLEPDVLVVLAANASTIGELVVEGAPDLIVEVLSPGTAGRDLREKREIYEAAGVAEYWIVDSKASQITVLSLGEGGFEEAGVFGGGDTLVSRVIDGFELDIGPLFERASA